MLSFDPGIKPILVVSFIRYLSFEEEIRIKAGKEITILLAEDPEMLLGEVCITEKSSFLKRLIKPFKK